MIKVEVQGVNVLDVYNQLKAVLIQFRGFVDNDSRHSSICSSDTVRVRIQSYTTRYKSRCAYYNSNYATKLGIHDGT